MHRLSGGMGSHQSLNSKSRLSELVQNSNKLGIRAGFGGTPECPIEAHNNIWKTLLASGQIWLNPEVPFTLSCEAGVLLSFC